MADLVCPGCGSEGVVGRFCSHCGASLRIDRSMVLALVGHRLARLGYADVGRPENLPSPGKEVAALLAASRSAYSALFLCVTPDLRAYSVGLVGFVEADALSEEATHRIGDDTLGELEVHNPELKALGVRQCELKLFLVYRRGRPAGILDRLLATRVTGARLVYGAVDLEQRDVQYHARLDLEGAEVKAVLRQIASDAGEGERERSVVEDVKGVVKENWAGIFKGYWSTWWRLASHPSSYANLAAVRQDRVGDSLRFWLLAFAVGEIFAKLLGAEGLYSFGLPPVVKQVADIAFVGLAALMNGCFVQVILWCAYRSGSIVQRLTFRQTFTATGYAYALTYPIIVIVDGSLTWMNPDLRLPNPAYHVPPLLLLIPFLSSRHGIPPRKLFAWLFIGEFALVMAVMAAVVGGYVLLR